MHILENLALSCGSKIDSEPIINTKFYPTPEKYIVLGATGGMPGKAYHRFQEVINIILPVLQENNIEIIQLGNKEEQQFNGVRRLNGETSFAQSAHIVKNALMVLSVDTVFVHLAAVFNIGLVALYSISSPLECGPFFGDNSKQILLTPKFQTGYTFSYNPNDASFPANSISIEDVVDGISKVLGLEFEKTKTLHISPGYGQVVIELIPDTSILSPAQFPGAIPVIRYDLGGSEHVIYSQLQHRKCIVYTDKKLDINVLSTLKPNVDRVVFEVKELNADGGARPEDLEFIKSVMSAGIQLTTLTALPDDKIGFLKLDLSEYTVVLPKPVGKRPENIQITDKTWGKSSKIICGANQTFVSYYHYKNNLPILNNSNTFNMVDDPIFWESSGEFLFIYDKG